MSVPVPMSTEPDTDADTVVYMDGVWDMFHVGHLKAIHACATHGDYVIIGVVGDADCAMYKRRPVIDEVGRCAIVAAIKGVDRVICPCPLVMTDAFIDQHRLDRVVHCFANESDATRQRPFFEAAIRRRIFRTLPYTAGISTTDIMRRAALSYGGADGSAV